jgi:hypothetical protein
MAPKGSACFAWIDETLGAFVVLGHAGEPLYNEQDQQSGHTANRPHGLAHVARLCSTGILRGPALTGNEA